MTNKPNIIIFRNELLPFSETFILAQGEGLQRYTPYYLGSRAVDGLKLPPERMIRVNRNKWTGKAQEAVFKVWGVVPGLYARLKKLQPVLIHAHFGPDGACAMPLAEYLKIPLLVTFHGYDATTTDQYAIQSFYRHRIYVRKKTQLKQQGRLFIAVSEFIKRKLVEQGFPEDSIIVHYTGVDTNAFQPDPAIQREPIVLFVGRLFENKGCGHLIKAMARVQTAKPEVKLIVVVVDSVFAGKSASVQFAAIEGSR